MRDSYLLRLTAFAGLFFASGTVLTDAGAGGGDDGGAGGTGGDDSGTADDAGDGAGAGAGDGDDADFDDDTEGDEDEFDGDEGEGDEDDDSEGDEDQGKDRQRDRREADKKTEVAVKKALAELAKTNPDGAKLLRKQFFTQEHNLRQFRTSFPTPVAARQAAELIETSGGAEGITSAIHDAKTFAGEINQLAEGNPELISQLAQSSPEGLVSITPHAVAEMQRLDPAAFSHLQARIMYEGIGAVKVDAAMDRVLELIADGKQRDAYAKAEEIRGWMNRLKAHGSQKPTPSAGSDPRERRLAEKEAALAAEGEKVFRESAGRATVARVNEMIEKRLRPYLRDAAKRGAALTMAQRRDLVDGIYSRIDKQLNTTAGYRERIGELTKARDAGKLMRFVEGKVAQIVKRHVRGKWHAGGYATMSGKRPAAKSGAGAGAGGASVATVSAKPSADQIDWSKDPRKSRFQAGEATLKSGKVVRWDWSKV